MTTYEQERSPAQREIDADILARVKRGLKWLEETHGPGWEDRINLDTLQMAWPQTCVLGQLYGNYWAARNDGVLSHEESIERGFDLDGVFNTWSNKGEQLQRAWLEALRPRVTAPS